MTDEQMDARLQAAGAAWRGANELDANELHANELDANELDAKALDEHERGANERGANDQSALQPFDGAAQLRQPLRRARGHRGLLLASAAVVAAALVAGGVFALQGIGDHRQTGGADTTALEGTVWRLVSYGDDRPRPNSTATLHIGKNGALVADDSCNLLTGKAEPNGSRLKITDLDERFYNCTDSVGEVSFFPGLPALREDPEWSIDGPKLTFSGAGVTMHLVAATNVPPPTADRPTLTGASWRLTTVTDAAGTDHPVRGDATLRIDKGRLRASDTCNTVSGEVAVEGGSIAPRGAGLAMTEIGCESDVMATAAVVDQVLSGRAEQEVLGATLTITREGAGTLTYRWIPDDEQATDPNRLTSTTWRLAYLAGEGVGIKASIRITDDRTLAVDDGCTEYTARATVGHGTLTTSGVPEQPQQGCAPETATLLSFLDAKPALWSIQQDKLLIYGGGAQAFSLVFAPVDAGQVHVSPADELTGRTWKLTTVAQNNGNSGSASGSPDTGVTLTIRRNGTFTMNATCKGSEGSAKVGDASIVFSNIRPAGSQLCTSSFADQAGKVLDGKVAWSIDHGQLTLTKGTTSLGFEAS